MLATTLASAIPSVAYAEVIKRNATASTTAMAQNYLNKGISSMAGLSYSKLLSNGSKYSFITDATLLPTLYSNWRAADVDSWYFYGDDDSVKTGWVYDHGWYYLSTEEEGTAGLMRYGWYQNNEGSWYFLNTIHDGTFGRAVSGWQWIDGYSYYFDENCRLVVSGNTTDGYTVDSDGRWTVDGVAQFVEGKGLTSQIVYLDSNVASNLASDSTSSSDDDSSNSSSSSSDSGTASGDNTDSTNTDSTDSDSTSKDEKDTDGDGVPDWLEEYLGTSSTTLDTDGDGISDYDEIYIIGSDPTVNDSNEDADSDGISNFDEINIYKTDPTSKDTDGDTLSDYDEIFVHYTDPLKADTDGDGISDADEIAYGFDPLVSDSDGNGTPDGQESITITATYDGESIAQPTAQIKLQAGVAATVNIERDDPTTSIWMTEDVPGMLDAMYDFTVDGEIEEATLTFSFAEDESADFYPAIYYVDTENQVMTELENQVVDWEAKTVAATTNHFSGYVTLNKVEQDRAWAVDIKDDSDSAGAGTKLDIAFVIDESRTMSTSDPDRSRVDIARDIVDTLRQGDRVSVIGFDTEERLYHPLTDKLAVARLSLLAIQNGTVAKYMTLSGGIWAGLYSLVPDSTVWNSAMINVASAIEDDLMANATSTSDEMVIDISAMFDEAIATPSEAKGELATASQEHEDSEYVLATDSEAHEDSEHVLATDSDAHEDSEHGLASASEAYEYSEYATDMQSQFPYVLANASDTTDETLKLIVLMTDGKNVAHAFAYQGAIEAGVKIHVLQIGEGGYTILLKNIAEYTGGNYYTQNEADRLIDDIKASAAIDIKIDSDQDGLSDYHEERIRFFTGEIISLNKYRADTDGDGLLDGEEIIMTKNGNGSVYFKMKSHPNVADTDFDGRDDDIDAKPLSNDFYGLLNTNKSLCNIDFTMDFRYFFADNTKYNQKLSNVSILFAADMYESYKLRISDDDLTIRDLSSVLNTDMHRELENLSITMDVDMQEIHNEKLNDLSINAGTDMYEKLYAHKAFDDAKVDFTMGDNITMVLDFFGFSDTTDIKLTDKYDDNHMSEVGLGHRTVKYNGETKTILAVIIRGTNGTIQEWASNFGIGDISKFNETEDWQKDYHHIGFDVAANRIMREVDAYVDEHGLDPEELTYWITGHSRGAGIANIIGANYEDAGRETYVYGFATPNTTLADNTSDYKSIFNIVNGDDLVPTMPMEAWGYKKYGRTAIVSVNDNHKAEWEEITSLKSGLTESYSGSPENRNRAVDALTKVIEVGKDPRVEAYRYTCSCHGDGSNDSITIRKGKIGGTAELAYNSVLETIPENAREYCTLTTIPVVHTDPTGYFGFTSYEVKVCQTPTYLMQLIAAHMANKMGWIGFPIHDVGTEYQNAKWELIWASLSIAESRGDGLTHPHYTESYYVLSDYIKAGDFK